MNDRQTNYNEEDEFINVGALIQNYIRYFTRRWFVLVLLIVVSVAGLWQYNKTTKQNYYLSKIYYNVERTANVYTNASVASRIAKGVPAMTSVSGFKKDLANAMGLEELPGYCAFYGSATASANMLTITINASSQEFANELIPAFEEVYPNWVTRSIGNTKLTVADEERDGGLTLGGWAKRQILIYGVLIGGFLWMILATMYIILVRRVHILEDMEQIVNEPCIGILPDVPRKRRDKSTKEPLLISGENVDSGYQQSIRALRQSFENRVEFEGKKVFLVTSTHPDEGKSLLTINLALALKKRGKRVVVIDADMHGSEGLQHMLNLDKEEQSLASYLEGSNSKLAMKSYHGIWIIQAGHAVDKKNVFMNMKRFSKMLETMKGNADVILIDTPPMGIFSDAVLFSESADAVLYVVRGDYAEVKDIRKCIEPFVQNGKLGGYILNRINQPSFGYGYHYGYGAGYSRYRNYGKGSGYGYGYYDPRSVEDSEDELEILPIESDGVETEKQL